MWEKIDTPVGYTIYHTEEKFGCFESKQPNTVTLLFELETGLTPGYNYDVYPGVEGLEPAYIIPYEFTTITICLIDKNGIRSHGGEIRYCIPITEFQRIK